MRTGRILWSLGLLVLCTAGAAHGQSAPADAERTFWVFLERQPAACPGTDAARARRALRGRNGVHCWQLPPATQRALRATAGPLRTVSRWLGAVSVALTPAERRAVEALPMVRRVQPLGLRLQRTAVRAPEVVQPGLAGLQLATVNAVRALDDGFDGRGVHLGFMDASYRGFQHTVFAPLRASGRLRGLRDFTPGTQQGQHGQMVASVAVGYQPGRYVGPAHGATVWAATTEHTPYERNIEEDFFVAGLEWLERQGVDVVNISLGYTRFDEGERSYMPAALDGDTAVTTRAADRAAALGVTVVTSAGNGGCARAERCWYYVGTPADADSVITVGAVRPDSSRASFSARGPTADGRIKPDVAALGTRVAVANGRDTFVRGGGTSFAAPMVSGIAAQMLQANPRLRPLQVRAILRQTASHPGRPNNRTGWGIADGTAAVRTAVAWTRLWPPPLTQIEPPYPLRATRRVQVVVRAAAGARHARITLVDRLGRVQIAQTMPLRAGYNRHALSVHSLPPGVYGYRVQADGHTRRGVVSVLPPS